MYPSSFIDKRTIRALTAKMLIEINAVHFNAETPYKLTSGLVSNGRNKVTILYRG